MLNATGRDLYFLNESNKIEGIHQIDYNNLNYQVANTGHYGAFISSQDAARQHKPLTVKMIAEWQKMITIEQKIVGEVIEDNEIGNIRGPKVQKNVRIGNHIPPKWEDVPMFISALVDNINDDLSNPNLQHDHVKFCEVLGKSFQSFESIHPFADGNGRTGRLLANYIATYCNRPRIVFSSDYVQRNRYYDAHVSGNAMCAFMAKRIQEAVFDSSGNVMLCNPADESSTKDYVSEDGQHKITVNWNELQAACSKW